MENEGLRTRHTNAPMRPPPFLLPKKDALRRCSPGRHVIKTTLLSASTFNFLLSTYRIPLCELEILFREEE